MIRDYSDIPANKRMVNNTDKPVIFNIRDKFIMVPVVILPGNALSVKVTTSEDLALLTAQCEELNLTMEIEGPDITDIVVNITPDIREGENNAMKGATIATLSLSGGTEPVQYTMEGTDADKFVLQGNTVTANENLTQGEYSLVFSALDSTGETYAETDTITVLEAYPLITDIALNVAEGLREGEANVQTGAVLGTLTAEGGTSPFVYTLNDDTDNKFEIADNSLKCKEPLTQGEYTVNITATDVHNKQFTKSFQLDVLEAYPLITSVTVDVTPDLRQDESNTGVGMTVGTISSQGGTEPITYTLDGTNANRFEISETNINIVNTPLTQGEYEITVIATDVHSKTNQTNETITVLAPFPVITDISVTPVEDLREAENNVDPDAIVADVVITGGTEPMTCVLQGADVDKFTLLNDTTNTPQIQVGDTPLTAGTYNLTLQVTDVNNKTMSKEFTIDVAEPFPKITELNFTMEDEIREGEPNAQSGAKVGSVEPVGGTAPYTYTMLAVDDPRFTMEDNNILVGSTPLTADTYEITVKVEDTNGKSLTRSTNLVVNAPFPQIDEFTIEPQAGLLEGNANVASDAVVATMSTTGGTEPYTYSFKQDDVNGADNSSFVISENQLKVGETPLITKDYKVAMTVTDTNNKTMDQNATISVQAPDITALNVQVEEGLTAPLTVDTLVANLSTDGGIAPYTYSIKEENDYADFKIDGTTVKVATQIDSEGTKNITVVVTDKNSKTFEQPAEISIASAQA